MNRRNLIRTGFAALALTTGLAKTVVNVAHDDDLLLSLNMTLTWDEDRPDITWDDVDIERFNANH